MAAGSGGLFALRLWPGLHPPGNDSNAPFASEGQSFLRKRSKIFDGLRMASQGLKRLAREADVSRVVHGVEKRTVVPSGATGTRSSRSGSSSSAPGRAASRP